MSGFKLIIGRSVNSNSLTSSLAALTQFQTNVFGVINVTNAVIPQMRERRSGTVVIIGSRSGWNPAMPVSSHLRDP